MLMTKTDESLAPPPLYPEEDPYVVSPEGMLTRHMLNSLLNGELAPKPEDAERLGYHRDPYPLPNSQGLTYVEVFLTVPGTRDHVKVSGLRNNGSDMLFDDTINVTLWDKDSTEARARQNSDTMTLDRYGDVVVPFDNNFSADDWMAYDAHVSELRPKVIMALSGCGLTVS